MPATQESGIVDPLAPRHALKDIGILPTAINALFQRENFRDCAMSTPNLNWSNVPARLATRNRIKKPHYTRMISALQLASRLIDIATPFYCKILCAWRFDDRPFLQEDFTPNSQKMVVTTYTLRRLAEALRIFRSDSKEEDAISRAQCVNMSRFFLDPEKSKLYSCPERPAVAIMLNADIFDFWTMPEALWKAIPVFTKQMYSFELAITLIHELAHAVWILRMSSDHFLIRSAAEPSLLPLKKTVRFSEFAGREEVSNFSSDQYEFLEPRCSRFDPEPELGWACEQYVLGMITWGVYWHTEKNKTTEHQTSRKRVGKPEMYFAPWILNSEAEVEILRAANCEQSGAGRPAQIAQVSSGDSWEKFIADYPADLIQVDEEYLGTLFKKHPMH